MDAFENIVAKFLEEKGYWVRQAVKVEITKEDKRIIGTTTMPNPILDIVAFSAGDNELLLVEIKSFLDSTGVLFSGISGKNKKDAKRYKLFTNNEYREIISERLKDFYKNKGLINKDTIINYALVAGKIKQGDENNIKEYFHDRGWKLFSPQDIKDGIKDLVNRGWEDNEITLTVKLLLKKE